LSEALDDLAAFKEPSSEATFGDPTFKAAALKVGFAGDALGVMVFYRTVPLHMLDNLMGRFIRLAWVKVKPFAEHKRRELGHNNYFEWFQWLAERLEEFPAPGKAEGAHVAHADWKP
jgi:hypothetical protein